MTSWTAILCIVVGLFLRSTSIEGMMLYCCHYICDVRTSHTARPFTSEPESVVQAEGLLAEFECLSPGAIVYAWFVNGTVSTSPNSSSELKLAGSTSGRPSVLTIPASSQFNNSVIQCAAFFRRSGGVLSRNATLIVGEW